MTISTLAPLAGITIVEIGSFVAVPSAGMTLAQLGATVIRIDPVGGGPDAQRWPLSSSGESLYWAGLNKGKLSVRLNLRTPAGQSILRQLLMQGGTDGGIVLCNVDFGPTAIDSLREHRKDAIRILVQGRSDASPAVDYTVNATSGFPLVTGPASLSEPVNHVLPAWDLSTGLHAAIGVLAAVRSRKQTGTGSDITISLEDVALATAGNLGYLAEAELEGVIRPRLGNHLYGGFANDFLSKDCRRYMITALTARQWSDLVAVTGLTSTVESLGDSLQVSFDEDAARYRYRETLATLIQDWFERHESDDIETRLSDTKVLWSRYRTFDEVIADERAEGTHTVLGDLDQPGIGVHLAPSSPIVVDGSRVGAVPAPQQGADTEIVLRELAGLGDTELDELRAAGVIERGD